MLRLANMRGHGM